MVLLKGWFKGWQEFAGILFLAAFSALMVRHFLLAPYHVPSGSMQPALKPGDFIFVSQVAYGFRGLGSERWLPTEPQRGDIVTYYDSELNDTAHVKRVIGVAGDRIEIKDHRLILNQIPLTYVLNSDKLDNPNPELFDLYEEKLGELAWPVIFQKNKMGLAGKVFEPLVVPAGEVFLLGDNREGLDDPPNWGTVPTRQIFGRVSIIWLSLEHQDPLTGNRFPSMRWERIFTRVH